MDPNEPITRFAMVMLVLIILWIILLLFGAYKRQKRWNQTMKNNYDDNQRVLGLIQHTWEKYPALTLGELLDRLGMTNQSSDDLLDTMVDRLSEWDNRLGKNYQPTGKVLAYYINDLHPKFTYESDLYFEWDEENRIFAMVVDPEITYPADFVLEDDYFLLFEEDEDDEELLLKPLTNKEWLQRFI